MRVILGSVQAVAQSEVHGEVRPHLDRVLSVSLEVVIMQDLVRLGADGSISLYNAAGSTDVIIDVVGYYN